MTEDQVTEALER